MILHMRLSAAAMGCLLLSGLAGCAQAPAAWYQPRSAAPAAEAMVPGGTTINAQSAQGSASAAEAPRIIRGNDKVIAPAGAALKLEGPPLDLRFEDVPVREAVHAILGDLLKQDYVVHPPADGRVTIVTAQQVSPDTAASLLEAALQANGLAMARDVRGTFHVGKPEALRAIAPAVRVAGSGPLPPGYGAIVVPLRYIGAAEMAAILRPLAPGDAIARVDTVRNLLVMVGSRAQAEGWLSMVSTFDIDLLAGMSVGVFPLKYLNTQDVEAALQLMSGAAPAVQRPGVAQTPAAQRPAPGAPAAAAAAAAGLAENHPLFGAIRVLPIERLNSVVVVTSRAAYLDEARRWIERLDQPSNSSTVARLHVYPVRNGSARHLAEVLNGIFGGSSPLDAGATGVAQGLTSVTGTSSLGSSAAGRGLTLGGVSRASSGGAQTSARGTGAGSVSAVQLAGNVRVVADDLNNAILVYGPAEQFAHIEDVLRRLDRPPTQVLIEASIIEVTLNDDLNYGVQWMFNDVRDGGGTGRSVLSDVAGGVLGGATAGFSYTLRNSVGNVRAVLNLLAEKSLVRVISSPSLMVLDNHTAQMAVGTQQPIRSSESVTDGGVRTSSIQYKDTGVSLAVTPSVGAGDMVTMTVSQVVNDVGTTIDSATGQRSFLNRQIESKVAVRSGEAVVLGGLIRDNNAEGASGIPLLSEIPVLGGLFGSKSRNAARTELLVIITPRVARSDADAREISREMRERLRGLQGSMLGGTDKPAEGPPPDAALSPGDGGHSSQ